MNEPDFRFWHKADMASPLSDVRIWGKADIGGRSPLTRFQISA
jgi:hypothetical protein